MSQCSENQGAGNTGKDPPMEIHEQIEDPSYDPKKDKDQEEGSDNSEVIPAPPKKSTRKRKASHCLESPSKNSKVHGFSQSKEPFSPSKVGPVPSTKKLKTKPKASPADKRSHHRKEQFLVCKKEIYDIKRHLRQHAKKGTISSNNVDRLASIAKVEGKCRGPARVNSRCRKPVLKYKWCPQEGCQMVTHLLRRHHWVQSKTLLNLYVKVAKEYSGRRSCKLSRPSSKTRNQTQTVCRSQPLQPV